MRKISSALLALFTLSTPLTAAAELPAWLRTDNGDVAEGNQKLNKGDAKGALAAFDEAAKRLPGSPGVQLNRGLALLKLGELGKAREALLAATEPSASSDLRADAYENLALGFYREADGLATQNKHEEAQRLFREAVDAAKRSLRLRPSDRNTAWNLELAARRIREEEKKQQDDKQKQDEQKQDDKDKEQDQKPDDQKQQDQKDQKPSDQDKKNEEQKKQDEQKKAEDKAKQQQPKPDKPEKKEAEKQPKPAEQNKAEAAAKKNLPPEAEQALDALQNSEENFERVQAKRRAAQERRAPEKDW